MKPVQSLLWLVILLGLVLAALLQPGLVRFNEFTAADVMRILTPLFLISLFMERATEVFLTAWRAAGSDVLSREVARLSASAKAGNQANQPALDQAQDRLAKYKSETQRIAFIGMLALGIVISLMGIRALELFLDLDVFKDLASTQKGAFHTTDVFVTGALLGGGSEGIHKLVKVITDFLDQTSKKIKET